MKNIVSMLVGLLLLVSIVGCATTPPAPMIESSEYSKSLKFQSDLMNGNPNVVPVPAWVQ